ncbi:cytochrome P450 4C1 isoform X2 [Monomorium pharaonis]|nr:cytochrome P450 4C1 isoform X2 [Monomorium pharaonis]XP_036151334.1 cytochrome P450 4C1 isoform X2 [Monomorium pharaonis]XP_036151335.1 cytochrome P450 4C1 isoform X2 [Monomorium pharaonis]XP_036151336.1 cytochrome P450 4C1 isoform X2 [Monomorium pharaonis]
MDFSSLILCTLCIIVIFAILSIVYEQYVTRQKFKNFPQIDEGSSIIASTFQLIKLSAYERTKWMLSCMEKTRKEGIFVQWFGITPMVWMYKPEYLEHILHSTVNITKGDDYELLKPWLGNGLITSTGQQWFHDRKLIGPTFHFTILDQFAVVQFEKAEILLKCIEKKREKNPEKPIDVCPLLTNVALDIICETAMGVDIHAQEVETKYTSALLEVSDLMFDRFFTPWYWIDWLYFSLPVGKKMKSRIDILHKFATEIINKKKTERQLESDHTEVKNEDDDMNIGKKKRKAFLDLLLDQNEKTDTPLTDDELRSQVDTFMFAGHDTTSYAMIWVLFLLGNNLEQQEKVHDELEEVFGNSETVNVKDLSKLKYLDRVIKETLRIFPSASVNTRKLVEEIKLDKYTIPKDTDVTIPIWLTHRNPEIWPDPLKFDPDRFLPENSKDRNPYAYVPFSAGPRNCVGQKFAIQEQKIILTTILRKYRVKSVKTIDTVKYISSIILRPIEEILIHFTPKK